MLYRDKIILHLFSSLFRLIQGFLQVTGDIHPAGIPSAGNTRQPFYGLSYLLLHGSRIYPHLGHQLGNQSPILLQQSKQQMFLSHFRIAVFII